MARLHYAVINVIFALVLWVAVTSLVQKIKCPRLSTEQIIMEIPKTVLLDFKN